MKKSEIVNLITKNKEIFRCITLADATIRRDYPHTAIEIVWGTRTSTRTIVKTMRGNTTDLKCIDELNKYKKWIEPILKPNT